jgi:WD40 repeat protein
MTIKRAIPLPAAPQRSDSPTPFSQKMTTLAAGMPVTGNSVNDVIDMLKNTLTEAGTFVQQTLSNAASAQNSKDTADASSSTAASASSAASIAAHQAMTFAEETQVYSAQAEASRDATSASEAQAATHAQDAAQNASEASTSAHSAFLAAQQAGIAANNSGIGAQVVLVSANFVGRWSDQSGAAAVPTAVAHNGEFWILVQDVADIAASEPSRNNADWLPYTTAEIVVTPVGISPVDTSVEELLPTLVASSYQNIYSADLRLHREWEVYEGGVLVYSASENANEHTLTEELTLNTEYTWRCRDVAASGAESAWSQMYAFIVATSAVTTPTLSVTGSPNDVPETPTLETSTFAFVGDPLTHLNTDWQVLDESSSVVWQSLADAVNLISIVVPSGVLQTDSTYTFRARHRSAEGLESAWAIVVANTRLTFDDSGYAALAVGCGASPFFALYTRDVDTFTRQTTDIPSQTSDVLSIDYSSDDNFVACALASSPFVRIHQRDGDVYTALSNLDTLPSDYQQSVSFAPEASYLVSSGGGSPFVHVYKKEQNYGISWQLRSVSGLNSSLRSCAWSPELGMFVVGASGGLYITYSYDGDTWLDTPHGATVNTAVYSIAWSPQLGMFCGTLFETFNVGRLTTSTDGLNWTVRSSNATTGFFSIVWSPELGIFCATGSNKNVITSTDGINWVIHTSPDNTSWRGLCWSPELSLFVAVGQGSSNRHVMTSADGANWIIHTTPSNTNTWCSVAWSPTLHLFVAVANGGSSHRLMTSPDGINWTLRPPPNTDRWESVIWVEETKYFLAVSSNLFWEPETVMTSKNGINWTLVTTPFEQRGWLDVCWSPQLNKFCVVSPDNTLAGIMTGDVFESGVSFTKLPDLPDMPSGIVEVSRSVFSDEGVYLAHAIQGGAGPYVVIHKRNGDVFTKLSNPDTLPPEGAPSVALSPNANYMAVGLWNGVIYFYKRSDDVFNFLSFTSPQGAPVWSLQFSHDSNLVAANVGSDVMIIERSGDTFTSLDYIGIPVGSGQCYKNSFSKDSSYLTVSVVNNPRFFVYKRSGTTFTLLPNPDNLPDGSGWSVAFSRTE